MRGSCILSAGILIIIAGMTTKPLPTEHHQLDVAGMTALASLADGQVTLITSLIDPPSTKKHDRLGIASPGHHDHAQQSWNFTGKSVQCDPLPILLSGRDIKDCLRLEAYQKQRSPAVASKEPLKAIYPQPVNYYLPQKPVHTLADSSRTRIVKLYELSTSYYDTQAIDHLLPTIDQFLATLNPAPTKELDTEPDICSEETWTQAPYFQKYGYRYVMAEDTQESETTEDEPLRQAVPDFVLDPIDGIIGPEEVETSAMEEMQEEPTEEEPDDMTDDSWFGITITTNESLDSPDEIIEEAETSEEEPEDTTDDSWFGITITTSESLDSPNEITEEAGDIAEEYSSDPYEKGYFDYEERYGSFYNDDYAIEYEAYEENDIPETDIPETAIPDTKSSSEANAETTESKEQDSAHKPLQEEADYSHESQIQDDNTSPPAPNGSFDIYWEETDPSVL